LDFGNLDAKLIARGAGLSVKVHAAVAGAASTTIGMSRAAIQAARFMKFAGLAGITADLLNKEIKLNDREGTFTVLGMKGRNNNVVLQDTVSKQKLEMPSEAFKANMTPVQTA